MRSANGRTSVLLRGDDIDTLWGRELESCRINRYVALKPAQFEAGHLTQSAVDFDHPRHTLFQLQQKDLKVPIILLGNQLEPALLLRLNAEILFQLLVITAQQQGWTAPQHFRQRPNGHLLQL